MSGKRSRALRPRQPRTGHIPRRKLIGVAILALAVLLAGCGQKVSQAPTPTATHRPTFTPVVAATAAATLTETATAPVAVTQETATPTDEPTEALGTSTATELAPSQTPKIVTATPKPATATATPGDSPPRMKSPGYGMQAFLWWRPEVAQRDLEMIRDADFGWVKQAFAWRDIAGVGRGQYDWSITDRIVDQVESVGGLKMIARLDSDPTWASGRSYPNAEDIVMSPPTNYQDFADFCYAVASRYKGRIAAYQIWNEPNLAREWGGNAPNPDAYVELLRLGYEAIKRADPAAIVISAGLAPTTRSDRVAMPDTKYLEQMYDAGAKRYFDALGAHGAGYKAPPEMDPGQVATDPAYYNVGDPNCPGPACRIYCFRHVEDLRQIMVDNGDKAKQVVVLEFGWTMDPRLNSPYRWHAVTEAQQADYFVRAYQYAKQNWQPWIGVMSLIYMPKIDWNEDDEQYWWSIAIPNYPQFYPYKSYRDLAAMPK